MSLYSRHAVLSWLIILVAAGLLSPVQAAAESQIVSLSPDKGPTGGGTVLTIKVEGGVTLGTMTVRFGDGPAEEVRRLGVSTLEVTTPPGPPGPVPVRVLNDFWGTSTDPAVFTYVPPPPRLLHLDPATVLAGSGDLVLRVDGEAFASTDRIRFGDALLPVTFLNARGLEVRVPASLLAGVKTVDIVVTDTAVGGGTSKAIPFSVVNPAPHVAKVEAPPLKAGGSAAPLSVRGEGFRPDSQILLAGKPVKTDYRSQEELHALIPPEALAAAGGLSVGVMTPGPGGGASNVMTLPVAPAFPGRFVVFTSNRRSGRNHIFLLDREKGRLDPLEEANSPNANDDYPSISADGRFIVFQSDRNRGQYDVFLFDREKRSLDPLPELNDPKAFDGFPRIGPDGRFIVFESDRLNGKPKVFLFDRQKRALSELHQANEPTAEDGLADISN